MAFDKITEFFKEETIEIDQADFKLEDEKQDEAFDETFDISVAEKEKKAISRNVVRVYQPVSKSVVSTIIDSIKRNELVIVNLSKVSEEEAKYIYSTLSGSIYSLDGELKMIDQDVMLCAPRKFVVDGADIE